MDGEKRKNTGFDKVSFSSYISTAEDIFVYKLAEPASLQRPRPPLRVERNRTKEGELNVFGAHKYFSMKPFDESSGLDDNLRSLPWSAGTPAASSEESWNSQTVLLRSLTKKQHENKKLDHGRRLFSNLIFSRFCSDGKSVYVNRNVGHGKEYRKHHNQINHGRHQAKVQGKDEFDSRGFSAKLNDPSKSMEAIKKRDIVKNLERKLSMFTWGAIPNIAPTLSSITRSSQLGDEIESDGSSDLFEIDNISGTGPAVFTRQASDGMAPTTETTGIEWSTVVTASAPAADATTRAPGAKMAKFLISREAQRRRLGEMKLGCKSQKAVMVAETQYKRVEHSI